MASKLAEIVNFGSSAWPINKYCDVRSYPANAIVVHELDDTCATGQPSSKSRPSVGGVACPLQWLPVLLAAASPSLSPPPPSPAPSPPSSHDGPIQVFVLAGQSNMQGYGLVEATDSHGGDYTLEALVTSGSPAYQHLRDSAGEWTVRDDVDVEVHGEVNKESPLTVGLGSSSNFFGPELQSGHVLGERLSQKVLLIKVAWGGRSLHGKTQPQT